MEGCTPEPFQLLTPKFFEQPPRLKLLPPSTFQKVIGSKQEGSSPAKALVPRLGDSVDAPRCSIQPHAQSESAASSTSSQEKHNNIICKNVSTRKNSADSPAALSELLDRDDRCVPKPSEVSEVDSRPATAEGDAASFDPKHDNQLLQVADKVSYSLAAKKRWKNSEHLAAVSDKVAEKEQKVSKILTVDLDLPFVATKSKGQPPPPVGTGSQEVTPTQHVSTSVSVYNVERPVKYTREKAASKRLDGSPDPSSKVGPTTHPESVEYPFRGRNTLRPSVPPLTQRNDLSKAGGFVGKPHTTDNLKPSHEKTALDTICRNSKPHVSSSGHWYSEATATLPLVSGGSASTSTTRVTSSEAAMACAMETDNDLVLARLLQDEEYSRANGHYSDEVKPEPKRPALAQECSSDFEIARRLQQEVDAEVAQSLQGQEEHYDQRRIPGAGRRLGGDDLQRREDVESYCDNNNQYQYRIRERVADRHSSGHGSRAGGTASLTRRPLSRHRHQHGAGAYAHEQEVDMSYETLVELEDVSRGLDRATIERLSYTYKYHSSSGTTDRSCSVCLSDFENGDMLRSFPCIHTFHKNCIDQWLTNNRHCPVCMKDIDTMQHTSS